MDKDGQRVAGPADSELTAKRITEIRYFLPGYGPTHARFYDESTAIYRSLDEKKEIERLKRVPQLGMVRFQWEGARHSRWETMMLQLDLCRRAKELRLVPLTTSVAIGNGLRFSSAQELMNAWTLLLNVGHLDWTFAAEQALLLELRSNDGSRQKLRSELIESIPQESVREWAATVFERERIYQFHEVLAFYRLKRLLSDTTWKTHGPLWTAALAAYVVPPEIEALRRVRTLYRRIRRIAFLTLDSSYTPSVVSIQIDKVSGHAETFARLLRPITADEQDDLWSLERYLSTGVYAGPKVLDEIGRRKQSLHQRVGRSLDEQGLRYTVSQLASGDLQSGVKLDRSLQRVARLHLNLEYVNTPIGQVSDRFLRPGWHDLAVRRRNRLNGTQVVAVTSPDATGNNLLFQLLAPRSSPTSAATALQLCFDFAGHLINYSEEALDERLRILQQRYTLSSISADILLAALGVFFRPSLRWDLPVGRSGMEAIFGRPRRVEELITYVNGLGGKSPAGDWEGRCIASIAGRTRSPYVAAVLGGLLAYADDSLVPCAEVDGLVMSLDRRRNQIVLLLSEAKLQRRRGEASARRDLRDKIRVLEPSGGIKVGEIRSSSDGRRAHAWCYLRANCA